jgi:hypothetical protein
MMAMTGFIACPPMVFHDLAAWPFLPDRRRKVHPFWWLSWTPRSSVLLKNDKNGVLYARILIADFRELDGIQYKRRPAPCGSVPCKTSGTNLKKGDTLKAIVAKNKFRGGTSCEILKVLPKSTALPQGNFSMPAFFYVLKDTPGRSWQVPLSYRHRDSNVCIFMRR